MSEIELANISKNYSEKQEEQDVEAYLKSFPIGFRFKPSDEELILCYLKPKLLNLQLPPNNIKEVELYRSNPNKLAELHSSYGEGEWYYFTPREKKYPKGSRPKRTTSDGFWKATGADKIVLSKGIEIGYRKALVFYSGKPPKGDKKTEWMMHEFRLKDPPAKLSQDAMQLDDWVICKIYKKMDKSKKNQELEELANLDGAYQSFIDDMMLVHNSSPFLDDIAYHYDQLYMPDSTPVELPSSTNGNPDELANKHHEKKV